MQRQRSGDEQLIERAPQKVVVLCSHQISQGKGNKNLAKVHEDSLISALISAELQKRRSLKDASSGVTSNEEHSSDVGVRNRECRLKYLKRSLDYEYPKKQVPRLKGLRISQNVKSNEIADESLNVEQPPSDPLRSADPLSSEPAKTVLNSAAAALKNTIRSSFEGYVPQGLLKKNWMFKHREVLPAVIALVCDFDVDCSLSTWNKSEKNILEAIEELQHNLDYENRSTVRIVLILIQNRDYPREMEVPKKTELAQDRITSLRRNCDLDAKNIVLVYTADFISNDSTGSSSEAVSPSMLRLQERLDELTEEHYRIEGKRLRGYLRYLDKNSVGGLAMQIRLNFKIAQYYEARESTKALKHYEDAYDSIVELSRRKLESSAFAAGAEDKDKDEQNMEELGASFVPYTANEIRIAAEYIHYRLVCLHVASSHVHSVLGQFKKHIQALEPLEGPKLYLFQHYHWLSRQYFVFADFITDIRPALALTHLTPIDKLLCDPTYYLHRASHYAVLRRQAAQQAGVYFYQYAKFENATTAAKSKGASIQPSLFVGAPPMIKKDSMPSNEFGSTEVSALVPSVNREQDELVVKAIYEKEGSENQSATALTLLGHVQSLISQQLHSLEKSLGGSKKDDGVNPVTSMLNRKLAEVRAKAAQEKLLMGNLIASFEDFAFVIEIYHRERWWNILALILPQAITCGEMLQKQAEKEGENTKVGNFFNGLEVRRTLIEFILILLSPPLFHLVDHATRSLAEANLKDWSALPCLKVSDGKGKEDGVNNEDELETEISVHVNEISNPALLSWKVSFTPEEKSSQRLCIVGNVATMHLKIKTTLSANIKYDALTILFNDSRYDMRIEHDPSEMVVDNNTKERTVNVSKMETEGFYNVKSNVSFGPSNTYVCFKISFPLLTILERNKENKTTDSNAVFDEQLSVVRVGLTFCDVCACPVTIWSSDQGKGNDLIGKAMLIDQLAGLNINNDNMGEGNSIEAETLLIQNIKPSASILLTNNEETALVGEIHPFRVVIESNEDTITNPCLDMTYDVDTEDSDKKKVTFYYYSEAEGANEWVRINDSANINLCEMTNATDNDVLINAGSKLELSLGVLFETEYVPEGSLHVGPNTELKDGENEITGNLRAVISYNKSVSGKSDKAPEPNQKGQIVKSQSTLSVPISFPFMSTFNTFSRPGLFIPNNTLTKNKDAESNPEFDPCQVLVREPFVLNVNLCCCARKNSQLEGLTIHDLHINFADESQMEKLDADGVKANVNIKFGAPNSSVNLKFGEVLTKVLDVMVNDAGGKTELGEISVHWSRTRSSRTVDDLGKENAVWSRIKLPIVNALDPAFTFTLNTKPNGLISVGNTADVVLKIKNNTDVLQKISVQILQKNELYAARRALLSKSKPSSDGNNDQTREEQFYVIGSKRQYLVLGPNSRQNAIWRVVALEAGNNLNSLAVLIRSPRYNSTQILPMRIAVK